MIVSGILMHTVVALAILVAWRHHVDTKGILWRMDANEARDRLTENDVNVIRGLPFRLGFPRA
jgi:hypothetical protein